MICIKVVKQTLSLIISGSGVEMLRYTVPLNLRVKTGPVTEWSGGNALLFLCQILCTKTRQTPMHLVSL